MKQILKINPFIALLVVIGLGFSGCNQQKDAATEAKTEPAKKDAEPAEAHEEGLVELTDEQFKTAGIRLGGLEQRTLSNLIRVNGVIGIPPQQQVSVSTPYGGILTSTPLLPGQAVKQGQLLAMLENPEFIRIQQEYLETVSQLEFQEQEYERQRELSRENVGSLKTFQQATSQVKSLRARAEGLRQQLALLGVSMSELAAGKITRTVAVRSPITGTVTEVNVNRGRFVNANDVLFELMNTSGLYAELTVFEGDIARVQVGQRVRLSIIGTDGSSVNRERIGRIRYINRETGADRTVRVYAALEKPDAELRPGTFLKALIETRNEPQPALPEVAVIKSGTSSQIFVYEGKEEHEGTIHHQFRPVAVRTGVSENGYQAVTLPSTVKNDAQVVIAGAYDLHSVLNNSEEEGGHVH
ncbi:efflux RND transporter periplasmic adaptor subunit [Larkinella terrae]|uniref:Efflux RND transporter periplasmic adaptor subunit n=1 Tax=Larkinella terrae TaxID=2025311 RepID=A0A7K0ENI5_9BACT|nr:efflux RND transporter periplasmic adaptor subunit [Larkinella terrae]MRS63355.1 efflux RND transporter periplasmic adaptor subunit [Larkinella terrae]